MRISCVHCGERGNDEFSYLGDAAPERPRDPDGQPLDDDAMRRWADYVYLRDNPAGAHRELWQHTAGCRAWLVVTRNTVTHAISKVEAARDLALMRDAGPAMHGRAGGPAA
jgi:methylglutamate dehydrogenase subunit B